MKSELETLRERCESAEKWMAETRRSYDKGNIEMEFMAEYDHHMDTYSPKDPLFESVTSFYSYLKELGFDADAPTLPMMDKFKEIFPNINGTASLERVKETLDRILSIQYFQKNYPAIVVKMMVVIEEEIDAGTPHK